MDWRQHILCIFKEGLHNALKYSKCTQVELNLERNENKTIISLKDNGKGFEPSQKNEGNGLINMKKRAQAIKAGLDITSKINKGTTIVLTLIHPKG